MRPAVTASWANDTSGTLHVIGPSVRDGVIVEVELVAACGADVVTWTVDGGSLPAGETVAIAVSGIDTLSQLAWADHGVELTTRLRVLDGASGTLLEAVEAPQRWIWFDGAGFLLTTPEEAVEMRMPGAAAEEDVVVAVLPPAAVFSEGAP